MTLTGDELLDLERTPRRDDSFRIEVGDATLSFTDTIELEERPSPPTITNDPTGDIKRHVNNAVLPPDALAELNPLEDRLRIMHVVGPGGSGYEYPLGVYMVGDLVTDERGFGSLGETMLTDQGVLLAEPLDASVSYAVGTAVADAIEEQAALAGVQVTEVDSGGGTLAAPVVGVVGRDSRGTVIKNLCAAGGYLPWYFENNGTLRCRLTPDLLTPTADHVYGPGDGATGRVEAGSVRRSNGLITAPNRYIAYEQTATGDIIGIYEVPATAPHSFGNRGRYVTRAEAVQGLTSVDAATAAARALYADDASVYESLTWRGPIDPRHETYDIVDFGGLFFIEQRWSLRLIVGGRMEHMAQRLYT